ncbi:histidine kinase, partial [Escherichia coli]|nr:histidine kinase [Escherichia coli]
GIRYDAALFAASIGIAVIASTAALWIAQALRAQQARHATAQRVGAAIIMGLAITGMHYTGMAAAHFAPDARCGAAQGVDAPWLATTVALFTMAT